MGGPSDGPGGEELLDDTPFVRLEGITKQFPGVLALDDVSLDLRPGEVHALIGENGSGKSTLAKILYGSLQPDGGYVEIDGEPVELGSPADALSYGIVGISQELTLGPTLTVTENILMGNLPRSRFGLIDWPQAHQRAREALAELKVDVDERQRVSELSIELQQEVEIARAVPLRSRVLVLDEATSSLSESATEQLLSMVERLRSQGVAIVFISHRLKEIFRCAQRATVLRDGKLIATCPLPDTAESELVKMMVGRDLVDLYGKRSIPIGDPVLRASELRALDGSLEPSSFQVRAGEILGVAGLVGSGKAELGLALGGAIPNEGEVRIHDRIASLSSPRKAIASGIGFVSDDRKRDGILPTRSVQHNLSLAWLNHLQRWGFALDTREEQRMAAETIERFRIRTSSPRASILTLSGGNQQKVVLSRWFALELEVLVLSEPTRGVDVGAKSEVYRFIQDMAELGKAVIMISSELPELLGVTDRILVMRQGGIRGEFDPRVTDEESITRVAVGADEMAEVA